MPIEAITFDYWDTLCVAWVPDHIRAQRRDRIGSVIAEHVGEITPEAVDDALREVLLQHNRSWKANTQYTHVDAVSALAQLLHFELEQPARVAITDALIGAGSGRVPDLAPGVDEALRALAAGGVRIGIICDVGLAPSSMLREHLRHHGLLDLFDHWSFSDEVGHYKPAPEIFDHALDGMGGVAPARAAHIGDLRRTDVAGARAHGMVAIRYAGITDDPADGSGVAGEGMELPEADHVITDHADLASLVFALP